MAWSDRRAAARRLAAAASPHPHPRTLNPRPGRIDGRVAASRRAAAATRRLRAPPISAECKPNTSPVRAEHEPSTSPRRCALPPAPVRACPHPHAITYRSMYMGMRMVMGMGMGMGMGIGMRHADAIIWTRPATDCRARRDLCARRRRGAWSVVQQLKAAGSQALPRVGSRGMPRQPS